MQRLMLILWPSFLVAISASGVYFSLFDPAELDFPGLHASVHPLAVYTIGFFAFWLVGAVSSALTVILSRHRES